ncbi:hypothetical protein JIG36_25480 [Actinoplanes sp. LDG1-06]|uniref:Uncharacterized protein n=1 Tax=Paractinoplanes ovalisporus TaxID=2810368 RepID=A0ABS2AGG4_9ACTN|nr:hypothetical protein [Actinoplanes ovalisporus]MBM2618916.1 hypothetical protein [Actinoplanes ovalisporus]
MTTTQTALMPVDPAISPAQASRVLTIRANLLPDEIKAGRNARRTRSGLILAVIVVVAGMAGWYFYAVQQLNTADENLSTASAQVIKAQNDKKAYTQVVTVIGDRDTLTDEMKTLLANDLPWSTMMDTVRSNAEAAEVTVDELGATVLTDSAAAATATTAGATGQAAASTRVVATLTIAGKGPTKKEVAAYIDRLANLKGVADPYVTSIGTNETGDVSYAITAKITSAALCGRFTTPCSGSGGN